MISAPRQRSARPVAIAALVSACRGADPSDDSPTAFVSSIAAAQPQRRALATPVTEAVDVKALLDWPEYTYPTLFPLGAQSFALNCARANYTVRAYTTGN